jgi:hemolysin type calcium-binding protein
VVEFSTVSDRLIVSRSGKALLVGGSYCLSSATPSRRAQIDAVKSVRLNIKAPPESDDPEVVLDTSSGTLGAHAPSSGTAQPRFRLELNDPKFSIRIIGSSGEDRIIIGQRGVDFDGDGALDVGLKKQVRGYIIDTKDGPDFVSGAGSTATGPPLKTPMSIHGGSGDDHLQGGAGDDRLFGEEGNDTLDGGEGADTASYKKAKASVQVNLLTGSAAGGDGSDRLIGIENVIGSAFGDEIIGDDGLNTLEGGAGNDHIFGGSGNDTITGQQGNDFLNGGPGVDRIHYVGAPSGVTVSLASGTATGDGADRNTEIENVIGSPFDDELTGDDGPNTLEGGAGNDSLTGGPGNDTLLGGRGDDYLDGGPGSDRVDWSKASSGINANLATGFASGEGNDQIVGIENVTGSSFADEISGDASANEIDGRDGDDRLTGGPGNDVLNGGPGNDRLDGGAGKDALHGDASQDTCVSSETSSGCESEGGSG